MVNITLIGESMARVGAEFYFIGEQEDCSDCKLKKACLNLKEGSLYKITGVREQVHPCALVEDNAKIVEVDAVPRPSTIPKKQAMEGSMITFKAPDCGRMDCGNYIRCHPPCMVAGGKYLVSDTEGDVVCPIGKKLVFAKLI